VHPQEPHIKNSNYGNSSLIANNHWVMPLKHVLSFQNSLSKVPLPQPLPPLPPFWVNDNPSDEVVLGTTTVLLYLSRRCRVCWWVLGYWLLPVVKSFLRSTLRLPCWALLWCKEVYEIYHSSASLQTVCFCSSDNAVKPVCGFLEPHTLRVPYAVGLFW
jgi:hypothetical protein